MVERYLSYASSVWKNFASSGWVEVRTSHLSAEDFILFWGASVDRNSSMAEGERRTKRRKGGFERKERERKGLKRNGGEDEIGGEWRLEEGRVEVSDKRKE